MARTLFISRFALLCAICTLLISGCQRTTSSANSEPAFCQPAVEPSSAVTDAPATDLLQMPTPTSVSNFNPTVQLLFLGPTEYQPDGSQIEGKSQDGVHVSSITLPGRHNFHAPNEIYLKLKTKSAGKEVELNVVIELSPIASSTKKYLDLNAIFIPFTSQDIDEAASGNAVARGVYLHQEPDDKDSQPTVGTKTLDPRATTLPQKRTLIVWRSFGFQTSSQTTHRG